ncbi:hypothetical protein F4821DRAFT_274230 [Hypoxylon rubiginosum]|uniref:Uncharacterized protein n=1 Tax=Hypoxylon rubiginosum TaxID=110542 RepID=A0ACC0DLU1_9PEZI|nr:hypothetical protein F4821DRAFT_274230 [Hypoxylon rubiginosum]
MATSTSEDYDSSAYWAAPARNFRVSVRLHLQHFLHQHTIGHLLDPRVETSVIGSQSLKIADLGCGNGMWLIELDTELSKKGISAQLDGYDINPVNFPASVYLPEAVTLKQLDVLAKPVPTEMVGAYDVVHIRGFTSIVINSDVAPVLSMATALLKPGGWLQWEDVRSDGFRTESPSPEIGKTACDTLLHIMMTGASARGLKGNWLDILDRHLEEYGLQDVHLQTYKSRKQDLKAWTEDFLMVLEDLHVLFPSRREVPEAPMTAEGWIVMFSKAVKETEQGVVIYQERLVIGIGRRAG